MSDKEVIKQALEALEPISEFWNLMPYGKTEKHAMHIAAEAAIQACRAALAEPSYTTTRDTWTSKATYTCNKCGETFDAEHRARYHQCTALAEQEPVTNEIVGCFDAAFSEGLAEALAETTDLRLRDLVERRLLYAYTIAKEAPQPQPQPKQEPVATFDAVWDSIDWDVWRMKTIKELAFMIHSKAAPQPQPAQDPVAEYIGETPYGSHVQLFDDVKKGTKFYTAPQPQPLTVPHDWKLVPVEPTEEMRAVFRADSGSTTFLTHTTLVCGDFDSRYRAMLAAAPEAAEAPEAKE